MKITIVDEVRPRLKEGGDPKNKEDYEDKVVNKIISHPDHKGKVRNHTEDELREMKINLDEVIVEVDKKLK